MDFDPKFLTQKVLLYAGYIVLFSALKVIDSLDQELGILSAATALLTLGYFLLKTRGYHIHFLTVAGFSSALLFMKIGHDLGYWRSLLFGNIVFALVPWIVFYLLGDKLRNFIDHPDRKTFQIARAICVLFVAVTLWIQYGHQMEFWGMFIADLLFACIGGILLMAKLPEKEA